MQPRDIATRQHAIDVLRSLDANYDLRTRDYDRDPSSSPQTVLGSVIERIEALWPAPAGPGPIEAHCAAVTDPAPVPADADRIAARLAGQPMTTDARRGAVIIIDHSEQVLSRDSRFGVCSRTATDDQIRKAVGLDVPSMAGLARVERRAIDSADVEIVNLETFEVVGYTND